MVAIRVWDKYGFGAVFKRLAYLVLLQFFTGNMFRHRCSPAWFRIVNRSTIARTHDALMAK